MWFVKFLVIVIVSLIIQNEAARILAVYPTPSISHQVVFRPLTLELLNRGHEVVVLTADPMFKKEKAPTNLTEIDVHELSYRTWRDEFLHASGIHGNADDTQTHMAVMFKVTIKVIEKQLATKEMQTILNDKTQTFDLLIFEAFVTPLLGLTTLYDAPVIQIGSFGSVPEFLRTVGAPVHPLLYPTSLQQRTHNFSFFEKIKEFYDYYRMEKIIDIYDQDGNELLKRLFGKNTPPLRELNEKVDMLFLNTHPIWERNRPVPPNVIFMGGLHQKPEQELPQDLKSYLDSSQHGVIYISFGTNVEPSLLPPEKIQTIINTFGKFPYDVLWKWNQDVLPGKTKNIRISKWLPQSDLLKHPKIKLFITQGGLQSTDEAITAGVPLIGMPMLGDQWFNVEQYVLYKIGLRVDIDTITEDKLETAIHTIINDKSYRDNILRLRNIMRDQPQTPLERAIWWMEYLIRHKGAKHLRSPAANMSLAEYLEIELILYLLFGLLSTVAILGFAVHYFYSRFKHFSRLSIKNKNN